MEIYSLFILIKYFLQIINLRILATVWSPLTSNYSSGTIRRSKSSELKLLYYFTSSMCTIWRQGCKKKLLTDEAIYISVRALNYKYPFFIERLQWVIQWDLNVELILIFQLSCWAKWGNILWFIHYPNFSFWYRKLTIYFSQLYEQAIEVEMSNLPQVVGV